MPSPPDPLPPPNPRTPPAGPRIPLASPRVPPPLLPPRPVSASRSPVPPPAGRSADDEEAERLLTRANIQLRRGVTADAEAAVHSLLAKRPQDAGAWELLADVRLSRNDLTGARDALQKALAAQPGRATAEMKLGRLALQLSERERMQTLGLAYAGGEASLMRLGGGGTRGASWSALASAMLPGLGQFVNGETVKGIAVAAAYFLSLAVLALLPDTQSLLHGLAGMLAPGRAAAHHVGQTGGGTSIISGFLLLLMTAVWLYGIVDAALAARRSADSVSEGSRLHP